MRIRPINSFSDLKKRIGRFLNSPAFARSEVHSFLAKVNSFGEVAIFGGMLRDLAISGSAGFKSDIDLVIKLEDKEALAKLLHEYNVDKNKFGGFRVNLGLWKVDLWEFESTWAIKEGYVTGKILDDLCKTTFFNWDAIIFHLGSGVVSSIDGYIDSINNNMLDINLEPNPSPLGNVIKAFRYFEKYEATFSPRLTNYICNIVDEVKRNNLAYSSNESQKQRIMEIDRLSNLFNSIERHLEQKPFSPFELKKVQQSIW